MHPPLKEQFAVEKLADGSFVSAVFPGNFGNIQSIAFGGSTLAVAVRAAYATAPPDFSLYSVLGHFHGPAHTNAKLYVKVHHTRDTRTFATRRVVVTQQQTRSNGSQMERQCLELMADFHVAEPSVLTYSARPTIAYKGPEQQPTLQDLVDKALAAGKIKSSPLDKTGAMYVGLGIHLDSRTCAEGMSGQNMLGLIGPQPTDQDALHVTERVSGDWSRLRVPLDDRQDKAAALAFMMDAGLTMTALTHNHLWFHDVGPSVTTDFALRLFVPEVDLNHWHLRERKTVAGGAGRTYSEARLWDEKGTLVASMTQQCILKPKKPSSGQPSSAKPSL
ncbi:thioesterase-like superfamily-domain-containing protein [Coniella lustricola]|uniref:Thioesterase-like superfamily-domain-containing protein n=1 Tax=Coniella lustricola TaxID=2025994 RepID=A0A2T2ZW01_9PEZI|nr:thioesterase-like superfamily-domain-containing protein [Coniella lustricola]